MIIWHPRKANNWAFFLRTLTEKSFLSTILSTPIVRGTKVRHFPWDIGNNTNTVLIFVRETIRALIIALSSFSGAVALPSPLQLSETVITAKDIGKVVIDTALPKSVLKTLWRIERKNTAVTQLIHYLHCFGSIIIFILHLVRKHIWQVYCGWWRRSLHHLVRHLGTGR